MVAGPARSMSAEEDGRAGDAPRFDLGILAAIGAVIASVTYVLLNSAYLEFYGSPASALRMSVLIVSPSWDAPSVSY